MKCDTTLWNGYLSDKSCSLIGESIDILSEINPSFHINYRKLEDVDIIIEGKTRKTIENR
jgi:hypothetical protein